MTETIRPFTVDVPEDVLIDLRERLAPHPLARPDRRIGLDLRHRRHLPSRALRHWADDFDWRAWEERFNRYDQFLTEIDGVDIHFLHVRSPEPDALPMILTHGWPGSIIEFAEVIDPLTDPARARGRPG